jgi:TRAP-type uncharacterized transport system substrate-binding protein
VEESDGAEEVNAEALEQLLGLDVEHKQLASPDQHADSDQDGAADAMTVDAGVGFVCADLVGA